MSCKVVKFYSYKDNTNKIDILKNTAKALALAGKRVAIMDLNFECPTFTGGYGLLEYLYHKQFNISSIKEKISFPAYYNSKDDIFVIGVGECDYRYIRRLESLNYKKISQNAYLEDFIDQVSSFYNLDYILINTSSGFASSFSISIAGDLVYLTDMNELYKAGEDLMLDLIGGLYGDNGYDDCNNDDRVQGVQGEVLIVNTNGDTDIKLLKKDNFLSNKLYNLENINNVATIIM